MELKIENADIGYGKLTLIENVNMTLKKGEMILLMGNNGMGKTTLIKSILNQIPLLTGKILVDNQEHHQLKNQEIAKKIAVVFSSKNIPHHYTTKDLVSLGRFIHYPYYFELNQRDKALVHQIISALGLSEFEYISLQNLSDGNLQKAFIARALVQESPMIILDEPTAHLDESNKIMLYTLLRKLAKENGKTILFSSHDWRLAKMFSDKIAYIKNKKMQFGEIKKIISENKELNTPIQF